VRALFSGVVQWLQKRASASTMTKKIECPRRCQRGNGHSVTTMMTTVTIVMMTPPHQRRRSLLMRNIGSRMSPDLSRGTCKSIGGDLNVDDESSEQRRFEPMQSLHHGSVGYQPVRT
jgi:hypothetical protein